LDDIRFSSLSSFHLKNMGIAAEALLVVFYPLQAQTMV
jgi:hypothetical protein